MTSIIYTQLPLLNNREIFFQSIIGSHNYNTNDKNSDIDQIVYVIPTFDDYFNQTSISITEFKIDNKDRWIYDVRHFPKLMKKSASNQLEALFSRDIQVNIKYKLYFDEIFKLRDDIARMNLQRLYSSTYYKKANAINKRRVDNKQLSHTIREFELLIGYCDDDFSNIEKYIILDEDKASYHKKLKCGLIDGLVKYKKVKLEVEKRKEQYMKHKCDDELYDKLNHIIYEMLKNN